MNVLENRRHVINVLFNTACLAFFSSVAPPSYAECVSGGASITNEGDSGKALGDSTFTPMYPFVNNYQFPSAPPAPFPQDPKSQWTF